MNSPMAPAGRDTWHELSRFTPARIATGRAGGSQRTASRLDFRMAHARARDAVSREFHPADLEHELRRAGEETVRISTAATDRKVYLLRPDLGRSLSPESRQTLTKIHRRLEPRNLSVIVADGLSALAAERHAVPTLGYLLPLLRAMGWTVYPVFVVSFARVKLQDEVGEVLGARHSLMLIGERPGLGAPDSLGAYFTFLPRRDRTDADRNCVSNIRPEGLPPRAAALKLAGLLADSARLAISGTALKDSSLAPSVGLPAPTGDA